jgi:hypothetical protein
MLALFILIRISFLWILLLPCLALYEGGMWLVLVYWNNDVNNEYFIANDDYLSVEPIGKMDEVVSTSNPGDCFGARRDTNVALSTPSIGNLHVEMNNNAVPITEYNALTARMSNSSSSTPLVAESPMMRYNALLHHPPPVKIMADVYELSSDSSSEDDVRLGETTTRNIPPIHSRLSTGGVFSTRNSIFNPKTPTLDFSPSVASYAFNQPKKKVIPPMRIEADLFELSSGSDSEERGCTDTSHIDDVYQVDRSTDDYDISKSRQTITIEDSADDDVGDGRGSFEVLKHMMNVFDADDEGDCVDNQRNMVEKNLEGGSDLLDRNMDDDSIHDFNILMDTLNLKINADRNVSDSE